jgi:predicted flap endonuclease-1-like 5' DNA nuclease
MMTVPILHLRGMSEELESRMKGLGIYNSAQLLEAAHTPAERKALAERVGVTARAILELANRADLARVKGIGGVFSDLLEQAGVDTVAELATRRPENLYAKLIETNAEKALAGRKPALNAVLSWVAQAKELPRALEY